MKPEHAPAQAPAGLPSRRAVAAIGVLGLGLWAYTAAAPSLSPRLEVNRSEAEAAAREVLAARGVDPREWTVSSRVTSGFGGAATRLQHRFVWNEAGEERHAALLGEYLDEPRWRVRYARFEGTDAARAEEHVVWVGPDGAPKRQRRRLAEIVPGPDLSEEEARIVALAALGGPGAAANLSEPSGRMALRPARTDWTFSFRDETVGDLADGRAIVRVGVAGDEVIAVRRRVNLPQAWRAADEQRRWRLLLAPVPSIIALGLLVVVGAVLGWTRRAFDFRVALAAGGVALAAALATLANDWPVVMDGLSTARPRPPQIGAALADGLIDAGVAAALLGLLAGVASALAARASAAGRGPAAWTGLALGLGFRGAFALVETTFGGSLPPWSEYGPASAAVPWLAAALAPVRGYFVLAVTGLLVVTSANMLAARWPRRRPAAAAALVLVGALLAPWASPDDVLAWAAAGLLGGVLLLGAWLRVLRYRPALVVLAAAAMTVPDVLDTGWDRAYGGALFGSLLGAAAISFIAWRWFVRLSPYGEQLDVESSRRIVPAGLVAALAGAVRVRVRASRRVRLASKLGFAGALVALALAVTYASSADAFSDFDTRTIAALGGTFYAALLLLFLIPANALPVLAANALLVLVTVAGVTTAYLVHTDLWATEPGWLVLLCAAAGFALFVAFRVIDDRPGAGWLSAAALAGLATVLAGHAYPRVEQVSIDGSNVRDVSLSRTPNLYFISFDSAVPRALLNKFLDVETTGFHDLFDAKFRRFPNLFSNGWATKRSLYTLLALDPEVYRRHRRPPALIDPWTFAGQNPSPLLGILRRNGYETTTLSTDTYLGKRKGPWVDDYAYYLDRTLCNLLDEAIRPWAFWGYCRWFRHEGSPFPAMVERITSVVDAGGGPRFTMAHLWTPGHTATTYRHGDEAAFERYRRGYLRNIEAAADYLDLVVRHVEEDPGAILLVYGDHGMFLSRGVAFEDDPEFFVQDRHGVLGGVFPPDACAPWFDTAAAAGWMTLLDAVHAVLSCLSDGQGALVEPRAYGIDSTGHPTLRRWGRGAWRSRSLYAEFDDFLYE